MTEMFEKYDNLPEGYIPENTHWPKAPEKQPIIKLLTNKMGYKDNSPIMFRINEKIADRFICALVNLTISTFRGEVITEVASKVESDIISFELTEEQKELLIPNVYYLTVVITDEFNNQITLWNEDKAMSLYIS